MTLERKIKFITPRERRTQIWFELHGPRGVVNWGFDTGWPTLTLGCRPPETLGAGTHSPWPLHDDCVPLPSCGLLNGAACFWEGTSTMFERKLLCLLRDSGEEAVFAELEKLYHSRLEPQLP